MALAVTDLAADFAVWFLGGELAATDTSYDIIQVLFDAKETNHRLGSDHVLTKFG